MLFLKSNMSSLKNSFLNKVFEKHFPLTTNCFLVEFTSLVITQKTPTTTVCMYKCTFHPAVTGHNKSFFSNKSVKACIG